MHLEILITIGIFIAIIAFTIVSMRYVNRQEIKFYERAQDIETRIKENDDMTYEEVMELFNKLKHLIHSRSERHRFIEIVKMIEVRYKKEIH